MSRAPPPAAPPSPGSPKPTCRVLCGDHQEHAGAVGAAPRQRDRVALRRLDGLSHLLDYLLLPACLRTLLCCRRQPARHTDGLGRRRVRTAPDSHPDTRAYARPVQHRPCGALGPPISGPISLPSPVPGTPSTLCSTHCTRSARSSSSYRPSSTASRRSRADTALSTPTSSGRGSTARSRSPEPPPTGAPERIRARGKGGLKGGAGAAGRRARSGLSSRAKGRETGSAWIVPGGGVDWW